MGNEMIAVPTSTLLQLCVDADERGYNRQLDVEKLTRMIDPEGWHVLSVALPHHEQVAGVTQTPDNWQHRCFVYAKFTNVNEPQRVGMLDVNVVTWKTIKDILDEAGQGVMANG